ncbi:MAG: adenylate/guanylate cyclase domain-containing protein, partial [Coleofasciculaceae cyanobacterium]
VISDAVNLAARLESLTKVYGASILISRQTLSKLDNATDYNCRFVDKVQVKGKTELIAVFEVYDSNPREIFDLKSQTLGTFEQAIYCYHDQKISEALQLFQEVLKINKEDRVAMLYIKRCEHLQNHTTVEEWEKIDQTNQKF